MDVTRIVIKKPDKELKSFLIENYYLDRLVTNIKLYQKDLDFISSFIEEYEEEGEVSFLPTESGILFIDFVNNIILNGQGVTGIGCVTPNEVMMSRNGNIVDETLENSVAHRFSELYDDGRLKGFEEWLDNGIRLNTDLKDVERSLLFEKVSETDGFGQFRFSTSPFRVELHTETNWDDRLTLFTRAKKLKFIPEEFLVTWEAYLERMNR